MKGSKYCKIILYVTIALLLVLSLVMSVYAQPVGLQKIIEFNKQNAENFVARVSFFIAFLAGIIGILSPCFLPFLPAYFSYTFKEKKNITKATIFFFIGFSTVFISMGAVAGFLGEQSLAVLQKSWLVNIAGILLVIFGIMTFFGKRVCSSLHLANDHPSTFLFGISFAFGWTACLGPILAGILSIGAILHNIFYSAVLMFFYSLGILVPIIILSIFYDKFNLSESKLIKGKFFRVSFLKKEYYLHSTNILSGLMLIIMGGFLLWFKSTAIINRLDLFGTKQYFYSLQNKLISWKYSSLLGILVFFLFVFVVWIIVKCQKFSIRSMTCGRKPSFVGHSRKISEHAQEPPTVTSNSIIPQVRKRRFLTNNKLRKNVSNG